jgi:hypothetical protein
MRNAIVSVRGHHLIEGPRLQPKITGVAIVPLNTLRVVHLPRGEHEADIRTPKPL